jgi:CBS domain containing-hemolysin-like protein
VPDTAKADDLLRDLLRNRVHMAVVVDEYGGTAGVVTIEDALEEIVGEIRDE